MSGRFSRLVSLGMVSVLCLAMVSPVLAVNQLMNGGFETGQLGVWVKIPGSAAANVTNEEAYEGGFSAKVESSSTTFNRGIEQVVTVEAGQAYPVAGLVKIPTLGGSNVGSVVIRVAWYASNDGSGSQLSTVDSPTLSMAENWTGIQTTVTVPGNAHSAKVRLLVKSASGSNFVSYWDGVAFGAVEAPVQVPEFSDFTSVIAVLGAGSAVWWMRKRVLFRA